MLRLVAAFILAVALAGAARADTSIVISGGGGFTFFSGSGGLHHFHRHKGHWRKPHSLGGGFVFHQLPRHHRLLLPSPHDEGWTFRRTLRSRDHGHSHFFKKRVRPQIIVVVPAPFHSRIKIVTVPGQPCFGTLFDRRTGQHRLVLLPALKPGALALAD